METTRAPPRFWQSDHNLRQALAKAEEKLGIQQVISIEIFLNAKPIIAGGLVFSMSKRSEGDGFTVRLQSQEAS